MLLIAVITLDSDRDEIDAITAPSESARAGDDASAPGRLESAPRVVAIAALAVIWFPLKGASDLRDSQIDVAER